MSKFGIYSLLQSCGVRAFVYLLQMCVTTWKLFETLLSKQHRHVTHNLVLRNIIGHSFVAVDYKRLLESSVVRQAADDEPHAAVGEHTSDFCLCVNSTRVAADSLPSLLSQMSSSHVWTASAETEELHQLEPPSAAAAAAADAADDACTGHQQRLLNSQSCQMSPTENDDIGIQQVVYT